MTLGYLLQLHQLLPLAACRSASVALPDSRSCYSLQTFLSVRAVQCGRQAALRRDMSPLVTSRVLVWRPLAISRRSVDFGLTIRVTPNNIFMVVYDLGGRVVFWLSRGTQNEEFLNYGRVSKNVVQVMLARLCQLLREAGPVVAIYCLTVRGKLKFRLVSHHLRKKRFPVRRLRRTTGLPHNGCRLPARRRGAKN